MKTTLLIVVLSIVVNNAFGQVEREFSKSVANQLELFYNVEKYDSIFTLFSAEMQKHLPLDKTRDFFAGLKTQAGKIVHRQFVNYMATSAIYKTRFERALFSVNISVDSHSKIDGLFVKPFIGGNLPQMDRNTSRLILPFDDEWTVVWGGDTKELNYHVENQAQKNAFDVIITDKLGKSYRTDGLQNDDYYAFGKELIAPCDGEIVLVVDGVKDNIPGEFNPIYVPGNTVILKTDRNEYLFFAHFKQQSIRVKQGQRVVCGQVLGLCGNSGNSSEAHLHFHIQNVENLNIATGVKCYFDKLMVNGVSKNDYSPVKNDKLKNTFK